MTTFTRTPASVQLRIASYDDFKGVDTSRDARSMETGSEQHFVTLNNCHVDWRGQIVRDGCGLKIMGDYPVHHVSFATATDPIWVEQDGAGMHIRTLSGASVSLAYPSGSIVSSAVFNRAVHFASRGQVPYTYEDGIFAQNLSPAMNLLLTPSYMAAVSRRLAVAGIPGADTVVHISRVDDSCVMPDDETPGDTDVLRAGTIDIGNLIGTADVITGLGSFENNRLVIFTQDRAIIYVIDPDIDEWRLDDTANIRIGCISNNTIQQAGNDMLFCSRSGIHSIKRSSDNGILAYSKTLSEKVEDLYRALLATVDDYQKVSAVFDQDSGQYHVFFPPPSGPARRLTLTLNPERGDEADPKFSTGTFLNARCGAFLGGTLVFGTPGGLYRIYDERRAIDGAVAPDCEIVFPFFWHGSMTDTKDIHSVLLQANGDGVIDLEAVNEDGVIIGSLHMETDPQGDDREFYDVPLSSQYERTFQHRYRAAQYRIRISGGSRLFRIVGFAVLIRK